MRSRLVGLAILLLFPVGCERKTAPVKTSDAPDAATVTAVLGGVDANVPIEKVEVPEVRIRSDGPTKVEVLWSAPAGTGVNDEAPFRVRWNRSDGLVEASSDVKSKGSAVKNGFSVSVTPIKGAPNPTLGGEINLVVCDDATHLICIPVRRSLELGFIAAKDASGEARVTIPLPQAKAPGIRTGD